MLVSPDRIGQEMAGAGIRYLELGRTLAARFQVQVAAPLGSATVADAPPLHVYDPAHPRTLAGELRRADVIVSPPLAPRLLANLGRRRWIVDLYNPEPFEGLEHQKGRGRLERRVLDMLRIDRISYALRTGDAFICASERQRDMWLGYLAALRRLDSDLYADDPGLRSLIDVVPFGLAPEPPARPSVPVLRGRVFQEEARIMLWQGGLWDWLDPLTVIRAVALLRESDDQWTLAFPGAGRPSHRSPMAMTNRARELVRELDLGDAVWFRDGWTPYAERHGLLLEADVGVSAHFQTLEARFSHRTRMLDYLWGRLPIVCTTGDEWSERVEREGLGRVVAPSDPEAFAAAVRDVNTHGKDVYEGALGRVAAANTWRRVAEPLACLVGAAASRPRRRRGAAARVVGLRHTAAAVVDDLRRRTS